jgi:hypothetical protein
VTILEKLPFARLRFDLETLEAAAVPAYKGDLLRMALLWWLSEYWCPMPTRCRNGCRRPEACLFGRLCEPPVDPGWPPQMQRLMGDTPPPAYALWDLQDRRQELAAGAPWSFELTLIGGLALSQIPAIVAAVQQGAEQGMGRIRLCSRVVRVTALPGAGTGLPDPCLAQEQLHGGEQVLTWHSYRLSEVAFGYGQAARWAEGHDGPARSLSLRYLSPVKIKERGQWVEAPAFAPVMKALVRRLRLLSLVHGGGEWPHEEWGPLLDLAEEVRLEHHDTLWTGYSRHSKTSGDQEIEGFVGQAWYAAADLRPLLPVLWLGQWLQIGKAYVLGNGRYAIEQVR